MFAPHGPEIFMISGEGIGNLCYLTSQRLIDRLLSTRVSMAIVQWIRQWKVRVLRPKYFTGAQLGPNFVV